MKNKSVLWIVLGVVLIVAIIVGIYISNQNQVDRVIKIGFIEPMSGTSAMHGDYVRRAVQIGVDDWNANNDLKIEAIYEDGKCNAVDAVSVANKLINVDNVDYIMTLCTGETNAVLPITEAKKIILLTAGTTVPNLKTGNYTFRNVASAGSGMSELTQIAYKNYSKIAVISENTDYAIGTKEEFKRKYIALGGQVLFDESFNSKDADFRTIISKLKDANISSVFVVVQTFDNSAILFKQMKELDYHPQIFATQASISSKAIDKYQKEGYSDVVEGAIVVLPYLNKTNPKAAHLLDEYTVLYNTTLGSLPESTLATHYDAVFLIGEATSKVGFNSDAVRQYFLTKIKNWDGAIGKFSFDEKGDAIAPTEVEIVSGGKIVPYVVSS